MRRRAVILSAVGVLASAALAGCPINNNPDHMTGTVKERTELTNDLPGCEKVSNKCVRVRICLNKDANGKGTNCLDYRPSEVTNCTVGAEWPKCKTVKK